MTGSHVFLCSVFFSLFGFYVVSRNGKSHLFLSSHGYFTSGHEVTYITEFSTTFLPPLSSLEGLQHHHFVNTPRKHNLLSSRVSYYPNSVSCFHQPRLVLSDRWQVKKMVKFKERSYLSKLGYSLKDNPCKFWSYYKAITKTTKIPGVLKNESVQATRPIDQANLFNVFFTHFLPYLTPEALLPVYPDSTIT